MAEDLTPKPGLRIGAFYSCDEQTLGLYGYGVYEGDEVPPEGIFSSEGPLTLVGIPVPKLRLDDGTVIWGCECWWNDEATVKAWAEGRQIIRPKIESVRQKAKEAWELANTALDEAEKDLP